MSRVSINCPHCGKTTRVDLAQNLSTQKCDRCGIRFSSVNTGLAGSREIQLTEPPEWRRAKTGSWDEEPAPSPAPATTSSRTPVAAWIAVATTLALVTATALTITRRPPPTPPVPPMTDAVRKADGSPQPSSYLTLRERIDAAVEVARQYLSAQTPDDLLPLIENRDALEPQLRAYYSEGEGRQLFPLPDFTIAPTDRHIWVEDLKAAVISYETPGQVPRALALRQHPDGRWLVDWPSAAAIGEVPLTEFRTRRDTTPRFFRVLANRDDFFNRTFANEREWVCLRLSDPLGNHQIFAYARRDTPVAEKVLQAAIARKPGQSPVMLRLRFPSDTATDNQVEITEFLGLGWLTKAASPDPAAPDR
jgi:hypothetical protein